MVVSLLAALTSKLYRINKLFSVLKKTSSVRQIKVEAKDVAFITVFLLLIDGIILICFQAINPLVWYRGVSTTNQYNHPLASTGSCAYKSKAPNGWIFVGLLMAVHTFILILGNFVAYQTRSVGSKYSEAKWVCRTVP